MTLGLGTGTKSFDVICRSYTKIQMLQYSNLLEIQVGTYLMRCHNKHVLRLSYYLIREPTDSCFAVSHDDAPLLYHRFHTI